MLSSFTSSCISLLLAASSIATLVTAHHLSGSLKQFEYNDADSGVETTDNKVFYLAPGMSYCNVTYRDESEVACVNKYWLDEKNSCQRFVKITNPLTGVTAQAQVLDKCGDVVNSTFGINDIYVSLKTFKKLSADRYDKNKEAGNLQTQVRWEFVQESCQACASGIFARDEFGREDKCLGKDAFGLERCGRKKGAERATTQEQVDLVCNYAYTCPEGDAGKGTSGGDKDPSDCDAETNDKGNSDSR